MNLKWLSKKSNYFPQIDLVRWLLKLHLLMKKSLSHIISMLILNLNQKLRRDWEIWGTKIMEELPNQKKEIVILKFMREVRWISDLKFSWKKVERQCFHSLHEESKAISEKKTIRWTLWQNKHLANLEEQQIIYLPQILTLWPRLNLLLTNKVPRQRKFMRLIRLISLLKKSFQNLNKVITTHNNILKWLLRTKSN